MAARELAIPVVRDRAEIADFHFHDLRHTAISYMIMNGVDLKTVAELVGHTTAQMVDKRYGHLSPNHKRVATDTFGTAMNRVSGGATNTEPAPKKLRLQGLRRVLTSLLRESPLRHAASPGQIDDSFGRPRSPFEGQSPARDFETAGLSRRLSQRQGQRRSHLNSRKRLEALEGETNRGLWSSPASTAACLIPDVNAIFHLRPIRIEQDRHLPGALSGEDAHYFSNGTPSYPGTK